MLQIRSPRRYLEPFFQFQHVTLTTTYKQRLLKHVLRKKFHELYQKNKKPNTTAHIPKLREERDREREREEKERKKEAEKETGEEEKERGEERKRRKRRRKRKRKKQKE